MTERLRLSARGPLEGLPPAIGPDEVFVAWSAPRPADAVVASLDRVERQRLGALARPEDRDRYATGAWLVRALVGRVGRTESSAVVVDRTCPRCGAGHGRPRFDAPVAVSVTHSGWRVGVALTHRSAVIAGSALDGDGVGLDVSAPDESGVLDEIGPSVFTPAERRWAVTSVDQRRLWTAKEAVLKAAGTGLEVDPATVEVTALGPSGLRLRAWPLPIPVEQVHLLATAPGADHIGTLAWVGPRPPRVREQAVEDG